MDTAGGHRANEAEHEPETHLGDGRVVVEVAAEQAHDQRRRANARGREEGAKVGERSDAPCAGLL